MSLTRSIKFEVMFPDTRKSDRLALYQRLWGVQSDLTRAANHLLSALWQVTLGHLQLPQRDGKAIPLLSAAYQGLSGAWQPYGHPLYTPYEGKGRVNSRASGGVISELSSRVLVRLKTDTADIRAGKKSLATFKALPIPMRRSEVVLREDGRIDLVVFGGRQNNRVTIAPRNVDEGQAALLARCQKGELKHGSATLSWTQRPGAKGKWMFSLAWTDEAHELATAEAPEDLVAGIDLGIEHAVWISYIGLDGTAKKFNDTIEFPRATIRAVGEVKREAGQRLRWNKQAFGVREGRGVSRKIRPTEHLGDRVARTHTTMLKQICSATLAYAKERGAKILVIEDHQIWSVAKMHSVADTLGSSRAAQTRKDYFRWHQGAMRQHLQEMGTKQGFTVIVVNPANSSRTCSDCGLLWANTGIYASERKTRPGAPAPGEFGRIALRKFVCSCGLKIHADRNAALNLARWGLKSWSEAKAKALAKATAAEVTAPATEIHALGA